MGREILLLVDALAREKNVDKEIVFGALELALASAAKKKFTEDVEIRASVDRATGEFSFFRRWEIVKNEEIEVPSRQSKLHEAQEEDPEAEVGEFIEEPLLGYPLALAGSFQRWNAALAVAALLRAGQHELVVQPVRVPGRRGPCPGDEGRDGLPGQPPGERERVACLHAEHRCCGVPKMPSSNPIKKLPTALTLRVPIVALSKKTKP